MANYVGVNGMVIAASTPQVTMTLTHFFFMVFLPWYKSMASQHRTGVISYCKLKEILKRRLDLQLSDTIPRLQHHDFLSCK